MNKLYKKILDLFPELIGIFLIILINWVFQSILYMGKTEKVLKLVIDLILFSIFYIMLYSFLGILNAIIFSFIIAHTLNWIFNGHLFALFRIFGLIKTEPEKFISYLDSLKKRSYNESNILLVATFGSISRKEFNKTSDLDVRVIRKKGFLNALKSSFFILSERSNAFFSKFPLDIYLCDDINCIHKLKEDPVPIYDPNNLLKNFNNIDVIKELICDR